MLWRWETGSGSRDAQAPGRVLKRYGDGKRRRARHIFAGFAFLNAMAMGNKMTEEVAQLTFKFLNAMAMGNQS